MQNPLIITREELAAIVTAAVSDAFRAPASTLPPQTDLLNRANAAKYLSVHPDTLIRWVHKGYLPEQRFGRTVRYRRADLDKVLAERKPWMLRH